jgi:hypothetical protein
MSYLCSSTEDQDILGEVESDTYFTRYNSSRLTKAEKVRRIFRRCMKFFIAEGGSCDYDDESIGDSNIPDIKKYAEHK